MIDRNPSARTLQSDTLDRMHIKLDAIRRQLVWIAIGVATVWFIALASLFRG